MHKKIVVRLMGGLGNQLFQYAAAFAKSKKNNAELIIDNRFYEVFNYTLHGGYRLDNLKIIGRLINDPEKVIFPEWKIRVMNRLPFLSRLSIKWHHEKNGFNRGLGDYSILLGHWSNESYFLDYHAELKELLVPKNIADAAKLFQSKILDSNSIAIHIRRGDYVENPSAFKVHGVCSIEYYKESISIMLDKIEKPSIFIFSNDLNWCKEHILKLIPVNITVHLSSGFDQETDLWLMSNAKHHIIANSTYSWWAAWLAKHPEQIVIAPEPWYEDLNKKSLRLENWVCIKK